MATTKVIADLTDLNKANTTKSLKMPSGGAFSGTATEGMLRNDTSQSSQSSASTMQFYNGTEWKNFVNLQGCTTSTCPYPASTTQLGLFELNGNANDTCGGTAGTPSNITYTTGKFGQAAELNGTNSLITLPINATSTKFVSIWVKADSFAEKWPFQQGDGQSVENYIRFYNTNEIQIRWRNLTYTDAGYSTGVWYNIIFGEDASGAVQYYINGTKKSAGGTASQTFSDTTTRLGARNNLGLQYYFDGLIDQVRIYSTSLTDAQAAEIYNEIGC